MKYKRFSSAAHNFARSFASTLSWTDDDYTMSWLARGALRSGSAKLTVDLLTGDAAPPELVNSAIRTEIRHRVEYFPIHLAREGVAVAAVRDARLTVSFELNAVVRDQEARALRIPFAATVQITDDRGVQHEGIYRDTWVGDTKEPKPRGRRWWRFWEPAT